MNLFVVIASLIMLQTPAGVTVSGHVVHRSGRAPLNEKVTMTGTSSQSIEATVGADGSFAFSNVLPGSYRLVVSPGPLAQPVTLTVATANISSIEIVNPRVVNISGQVKLDAVGLLPNITMSFSPYSGGTSPTALIDNAGTLRAQLTDGDYRVSWSNLPEGYFVRSIVAGTVDLLSNPLQVSGDSPSVVVTLGVASPPPWVRVRGRVTGLPATQGARLSLLRIGGGTQVQSASLAADGSFEFPMILPGSYTVSISPPPPVPLPGTQFYVGRNNIDDALFSVPVTRCIPGRVIVEGDGPVPNLTFTLTDPAVSAGNEVSPIARLAGAILASVTPSDSGNFGVRLQEGERRITVSGSVPQGYTVKSFTYGSTNLLQQPLQVSAANPGELTLTFATAPGSWASVSGRVTGIDPKARTYRLSIGALRAPDINLASDGSFHFAKVLRGNYMLRLSSIGGIDVSKAITVAGQDLDVEIAAPAQREVSGRVTADSGRPAGMYTLVLTSGNSASREISMVANNDGSFKVALPEGEYRVSVKYRPIETIRSFTYGDADLLKGPVRVSRGDTAELRLTLGPDAAIGGVLGGVLGGTGRNDCVP